ncbi:MAG: DUF1593 domain-containing protein [Planctomycetales bacterium]|nr:DUF1593 domain-containing protein [Planctomycetales bacterium]
MADKRITTAILLVASGLCSLTVRASEPQAVGSRAAADRPRLIVLTDIGGGDPDDQQSLIRLMLHSNEFDIEGLIASAPTLDSLKETGTKPQLIHEIVDAYGQVRKNLVQHADGFPETARLREVIQSGNPKRGREAIGEGHDTDGSRWIVNCAERSDSRRLNIVMWGGQTDLAQALWRIRHERGVDGLKAFAAKVRVYDTGDQDRIADWMLSEFPGLSYILARPPAGRDRREAAYRGLYLGGDESLVSRDWMEAHIRQNHGPLGAMYPPRTWTAPNPYSAIKERDTPSWFHFLPFGLSDPDHPEWGGWGGRFEPERDRIFRDTTDKVGEVKDARTTVWRWRPAFQNEFAARLDWCVKPPTAANHPPRPMLNGQPGRDAVVLKAKPDSVIEISSTGSTDPDGDTLQPRWWFYSEASSYRSFVEITGADTQQAKVTIPAAANQTLHVILELQDSGTPPLTRYRRVVIRVEQ